MDVSSLRCTLCCLLVILLLCTPSASVGGCHLLPPRLRACRPETGPSLDKPARQLLHEASCRSLGTPRLPPPSPVSPRPRVPPSDPPLTLAASLAPPSLARAIIMARSGTLLRHHLRAPRPSVELSASPMRASSPASHWLAAVGGSAWREGSRRAGSTPHVRAGAPPQEEGAGAGRGGIGFAAPPRLALCSVRSLAGGDVDEVPTEPGDDAALHLRARAALWRARWRAGGAEERG